MTDVVVDQGGLERLLGYGTITVLANDDSTPQVELVSLSRPTQVKEMIRNQYRAARQREGVHPTEFMKSSVRRTSDGDEPIPAPSVGPPITSDATPHSKHQPA